MGKDAPDECANWRLPLIVTEDLQQRAEWRAELCDQLRVRGLEPPSRTALNGVLSRCQDVDLAFTALTMLPRPAWVHEIAGPLDLSAVDLASSQR
jgi:hypothetical protein